MRKYVNKNDCYKTVLVFSNHEDAKNYCDKSHDVCNDLHCPQIITKKKALSLVPAPTPAQRYGGYARRIMYTPESGHIYGCIGCVSVGHNEEGADL